jgi:hypothetical protein
MNGSPLPAMRLMALGSPPLSFSPSTQALNKAVIDYSKPECCVRKNQILTPKKTLPNLSLLKLTSKTTLCP